MRASHRQSASISLIGYSPGIWRKMIAVRHSSLQMASTHLVCDPLGCFYFQKIIQPFSIEFESIYRGRKFCNDQAATHALRVKSANDKEGVGRTNFICAHKFLEMLIV